MVDDNKMYPETSPSTVKKSGIRRVNKIPMFIAIGALMLFCLIVSYVANQRTKQQNNVSADREQHKGSTRDSSLMAAEVLGGINDGLIAPSAPPTLQSDKLTPNLPRVPIAPVADLDKPPIPHAVPSKVDPEFEQIRRNKLRDFIEAVKAPTPVNLSQQMNQRANAENGRTPQTRDEMMQRLADIRRQIAIQNSGDTNAYYQAQVQQTRAVMTGSGAMYSDDDGGMQLISSPVASGKDFSQFDKKGQNDRWLLNEKVSAPHTQFELRAGGVIPGIMISGINSDLPGQITGQVAQDVYDTATSKYLLIPHGTRIIGSYSSNIAYGQNAVLIAWQRLIFPDGKALDIGSMPGGDMAGYSGFRDQVNNHYARIFTSAFLLTGVIAGIAYSQDRNNNNTGYQQPTMGNELSQALGQTLGQTTAQLISKNMNISPTIEIRPGYRFNIMVTKDIAFTKPYQSFNY